MPDARIDGFDISEEQYPPEGWYGNNVSLSKLGIFEPLPERLKGVYDVVHLRFFMTVASDDDVQVVIGNLRDMLSEWDPGSDYTGLVMWLSLEWDGKEKVIEVR